MILKKGVKTQGLRPEIFLAILVANEVYKEYEKELVITSALDGKHSKTSLHYSGCAIDTRTRYFTVAEKMKVTAEIKERLGEDYDVVLEPDHLHIEYQPRGEQ